MEARDQAQSGAVEAYRAQRQQKTDELRAYKEVGESELATLHEQAALVKERIRLRDSIAMQQQHIAAFNALDKVNTKNPDTNLDEAIDKIQVDNPLVAKDPAWRQAVAHRYSEQAQTAESSNKIWSTALDLLKEYKTPVVKDERGIPDLEKMRQNILTSQAQEKSQLPAFKPVEYTVDASGKISERFEPGKTSIPEGVRLKLDAMNAVIGDETADSIAAKISENAGKYDQNKPSSDNDNAALIAEKNALVETQKNIRVRDAIQKDFMPPPNSAPASVQPPDMKALAQQALDDPNATPEHKAAAQKILGLSESGLKIPDTTNAPAQ